MERNSFLENELLCPSDIKKWVIGLDELASGLKSQFEDALKNDFEYQELKKNHEDLAVRFREDENLFILLHNVASEKILRGQKIFKDLKIRDKVTKYLDQIKNFDRKVEVIKSFVSFYFNGYGPIQDSRMNLFDEFRIQHSPLCFFIKDDNGIEREVAFEVTNPFFKIEDTLKIAMSGLLPNIRAQEIVTPDSIDYPILELNDYLTNAVLFKSNLKKAGEIIANDESVYQKFQEEFDKIPVSTLKPSSLQYKALSKLAKENLPISDIYRNRYAESAINGFETSDLNSLFDVVSHSRIGEFHASENISQEPNLLKRNMFLLKYFVEVERSKQVSSRLDNTQINQRQNSIER
jgi:hypothetical protein